MNKYEEVGDLLAIWVHISMYIRCLKKCLWNEDIKKKNHFQSNNHTRKSVTFPENVLRQNTFYADTSTI